MYLGSAETSAAKVKYCKSMRYNFYKDKKIQSNKVIPYPGVYQAGPVKENDSF